MKKIPTLGWWTEFVDTRDEVLEFTPEQYEKLKKAIENIPDTCTSVSTFYKGRIWWH